MACLKGGAERELVASLSNVSLDESDGGGERGGGSDARTSLSDSSLELLLQASFSQVPRPKVTSLHKEKKDVRAGLDARWVGRHRRECR